MQPGLLRRLKGSETRRSIDTELWSIWHPFGGDSSMSRRGAPTVRACGRSEIEHCREGEVDAPLLLGREVPDGWLSAWGFQCCSTRCRARCGPR